MNAHAVRIGLKRGWTELRQTLTTGQDLRSYLVPTVILLFSMFMQRDSKVHGTTFSLGTMMLPGVLGLVVLWGGFLAVAQQLAVEREDGTLLRAKALPNGMPAYLIGKIVVVGGMTLISMLIILVPGLLLFPGLDFAAPHSWMTLLWVAVLGMVASMPLGAIAGSFISNPRNLGLIVLPMMAVMIVSGIFFPMAVLPEWLQWIAQVFPMYWLGLGMRSALLPDSMAALEVGGSWHHLETVAVLGVWAVVGLVVAPVVLRRMARRESGSRVAARREKALQRTT